MSSDKISIYDDVDMKLSEVRAVILQNAQQTIEKGTALWVHINEIIQLLLPPQFATVYNDILEFVQHSAIPNTRKYRQNKRET